MHRIDTSTRGINQNGAGKDGFRDENAGTGQKGTDASPAWLNDIQENLAEAITGAGIALVKGTFTQLRDAMRLLSGVASGTPYNIGTPTTAPAAGNLLQVLTSTTSRWIQLGFNTHTPTYAVTAGTTTVTHLGGFYLRLGQVALVAIDFSAPISGEEIIGVTATLPINKTAGANRLFGVANAVGSFAAPAMGGILSNDVADSNNLALLTFANPEITGFTARVQALFMYEVAL